MIFKSKSIQSLTFGISLMLILSLLLIACSSSTPVAPAPDTPTEAPAAPEPTAEVPVVDEPPSKAAVRPVAPESMYQEAPMLAAMVAAGDLPPVDERLPDEPLVEEVVESIGVYGGTLRRAFLGPATTTTTPVWYMMPWCAMRQMAVKLSPTSPKDGNPMMISPNGPFSCARV